MERRTGQRWSVGRRSLGQRDATDDAKVTAELGQKGRAVVTVSLPPGLPGPIDAVAVAGAVLDAVIALELNSSGDSEFRASRPAIRHAA